ncbi:oxidoreductase [Nocardioides sp. KR10-350]|uniref:oxidoreductase n=1 Tax=Nocardioides cheoyonin TaxID=3156615 RepID=UPI0032B629E6
MTWGISDLPDLGGRTAVVTGPSVGGIGWYVARGLASHRAGVILAGRSWARLDEAEKALRDAVPDARTDKVMLDLADLQSVRAGAEAIGDAAYELGGQLHLLVNNAGVMATPQKRTVDGLDLQLATNHFGPFLLTGLLLESLAESGSGRVVTVSSLMHRFARTAPLRYPTVAVGRYSAWGAYCQSKLANLLFVAELDRRLRAAGLPVSAVAAHPGYADTRLVANGPLTRWGVGRAATIGQAVSSAVAQSPESGALPVLMAATADLPGGTYVGPGGPFEVSGPPRVVRPSRPARDPDAARALWELSEQTTGIAYP